MNMRCSSSAAASLITWPSDFPVSSDIFINRPCVARSIRTVVWEGSDFGGLTAPREVLETAFFVVFLEAISEV